MTVSHEQPSQPRSWRIYGHVRSTVLTIAAVIGVLCVLAVVVGTIFRISPMVVISGSMEPGIPTGSLLLTQERSVQEVTVGDIVTVDRVDGRGRVTHRVHEIEDVGGAITLTLKGDANRLVDPTTYTPGSVGAHILTLPGLGHVAGFLQTDRGLLLAGALLFALIGLTLFEPATRRRGRRASQVPDAPRRGRRASHAPLRGRRVRPPEGRRRGSPVQQDQSTLAVVD